jgi:predicted metalloprotease with PDZ domain
MMLTLRSVRNRFLTQNIMKYSSILSWVFLFQVHLLWGQDTISYTVSFPNAVHHEAEISIRFKNVSAQSMKAIMSSSSPGRYAIHNFAKNIYNVKALNDDGISLPIKMVAPGTWLVNDASRDVTIEYTLYANNADGTYSGIDAEFALLNIPSSLMWLEHLTENPIKISFKVPNSRWKIANSAPYARQCQTHLLCTESSVPYGQPMPAR